MKKRFTNRIFWVAWIYYAMLYSYAYYRYNIGDSALGEYVGVIDIDCYIHKVCNPLVFWAWYLFLVISSAPLVVYWSYIIFRNLLFRFNTTRQMAIKAKWLVRSHINIDRWIKWTTISAIFLLIYSLGIVYLLHYCGDCYISLAIPIVAGIFVLSVVVPMPFLLEYWRYRRNPWLFVIGMFSILFSLTHFTGNLGIDVFTVGKYIPRLSEICFYALLMSCLLIVIRAIWDTTPIDVRNKTHDVINSLCIKYTSISRCVIPKIKTLLKKPFLMLKLMFLLFIEVCWIIMFIASIIALYVKIASSMGVSYVIFPLFCQSFLDELKLYLVDNSITAYIQLIGFALLLPLCAYWVMRKIKYYHAKLLRI